MESVMGFISATLVSQRRHQRGDGKRARVLAVDRPRAGHRCARLASCPGVTQHHGRARRAEARAARTGADRRRPC